MLLGAHESVAGGVSTAFARGAADGIEAMQIFARPKAQWHAPALGEAELAAFRRERRSAGRKWPLLSHASYLINVGSSDPVVRERSAGALADELDRAEALGLDYVVLHPGSHRGDGAEAGTARITAALSELMARTRGYHVRLLLELTAGQGSCLGASFDELGRLMEGTRGGDRLGICFDTCHAYSAGLDLVAGYDEVFAAYEARLGLHTLHAFHLNDSKTALGSGVDRHAEIGAGTMGLAPFWRLVNDARFAKLPGLLELPPECLPANLATLRGLVGAKRPGRGRATRAP